DLNRDWITDELVTFAMRAASAQLVGGAFLDLKTFDLTDLRESLQAVEQYPALFEDLGVSLLDAWPRIFEQDNRESFPTGFRGLDAAMRGGMRPGELICFLAAPKRGKTLALINMGLALVTMGYTVAHYSLEMYWGDVHRRYLGCATNRLVNG